MPRTRRRQLLPVTAPVLGVLLATAGCGLSVSVSGHPGPPPGVTPTPSGPTSAQLTSALPAIPAGSKPWAATFGPFGALTARQMVSDTFGAANVAADLPIETRRGLEFGAVQRWLRPDGVLVSVFLSRYAENAGALSAFLGQRSNEQAKDGGDAHLTVPGIADSYAVELPQLNGSGEANTNLNAVAGDVLIRVLVGAPATPDRTVTVRTTEQVYAAVCEVTDCSSEGS
jgi:hypothetical protein